MSKKKKTSRSPVSENTFKAFIGILWTLVKSFGIDKCSEACHYLQLATDEIERYLFEEENPVVTRHRDDAERRKYITIFKTRFLELTDFEYDKAITPVEAKMINQLCISLREKGFTIDEYLGWMFEDFLPTAEKFCPPQLRWTCSDFIVSKFLYEHRERLKQKKEQELKSKISLDLINRARTCMRQLGTEDLEKIKEILKRFISGGIMIDEMRKTVEFFEAKIGQK